MALGHVDELVARLLLVDQARLRAHGAGRDGEQRADRRGDDEPAAAEQQRAGQRDHDGGPSSVRCVPIAGIRTSAERNVPSRLPTVDSA